MTRAIFSACCAIAWFAMASTPLGAAPPPTPTKKTTGSTSKAATPAKKNAAPAVTPAKKGAPAGARTTVGKSAPKTPARPVATNNRYNTYRRRYTPTQQTPTNDRYREIQDALAAKGYLKSQPTGVWDKDSMDAMQRFQQDQKLDNPNGKLTARSLNALGLGPKTGEAGDQ